MTPLANHIDKLLAMPGLTPEARALLKAAKIAEACKSLPSAQRLQQMLHDEQTRCDTAKL